jgi:hypothetical protein
MKRKKKMVVLQQVIALLPFSGLDWKTRFYGYIDWFGAGFCGSAADFLLDRYSGGVQVY